MTAILRFLARLGDAVLGRPPAVDMAARLAPWTTPTVSPAERTPLIRSAG